MKKKLLVSIYLVTRALHWKQYFLGWPETELHLTP